MDALSHQIRSNFESVQERIERSAHNAGRNSADVQLVVVTKAQPAEVVYAAIEAGAKIIGENYAEEALVKMQSLGGNKDISWHMIGHVQSRKAHLVISNFDWVHSLDSLKLAEKYNTLASELKKKLPVLLEINTGDEETKFGWSGSLSSSLELLFQDVEKIAAMQNLEIRGLMTMPPLSNNPESSRPYFKRLVSVQDALVKLFPAIKWQALSMGTSSDFEVAVQEGSTFVRIGRAILGMRPEIYHPNIVDNR